MGVMGGAIGILSAYLFLSTGNFAISAEGLSIVFNIHTQTILKAACLALSIGLLSGIYPALHSMRGSLVNRLRTN